MIATCSRESGSQGASSKCSSAPGKDGVQSTQSEGQMTRDSVSGDTIPFGSSCVSGGNSKMHERRGIIPSLERDLADGFSLTRMVCARMLNILNLIDDARCFETVRAMRWPQGVTCPTATLPKSRNRGTTNPSRNDKSMSAPSVGSSSTTSPIFAGHHQPLRSLDALPLFYGAESLE